MRWREALHPVSMQRVAVVAPRERLRDLLVQVADHGTLELDPPQAADGPADLTPAREALRRSPTGPTTAPLLTGDPPDPEQWERIGRVDLIAGEAELEERAAQAVRRGRVAALAGWTPADAVPGLSSRLAGLGGAVVPLPRPAGVQPPTLLPPSGPAREFAPLVDTYATVPYVDLDPSVVAGLAYVLMFGMMFADAGEGALLLALALVVRSGRPRRLAVLQRGWLFLAGAGACSMLFGILYGEFFGPTGVNPVVWLAPLEHPVTLLVAAIGVGAALLTVAYALGIVNRFREGGWRRALYAPSGIAGVTVFLGLGLLAAALYLDVDTLLLAAALVSAVGLALAFLGLLMAAGGGVAGAAQAAVELVDLVVRIGSNLVSFARLAAFGLTHAALGLVVWQATTALWDRGPAGALMAIVVFLVGTALAFGLEGLVAAVQALRLEYYELFSRIFDGEGRPFRPWHIPLDPALDAALDPTEAT
jgi:V/A-type H+-transporting ATPase subunit I